MNLIIVNERSLSFCFEFEWLMLCALFAGIGLSGAVGFRASRYLFLEIYSAPKCQVSFPFARNLGKWMDRWRQSSTCVLWFEMWMMFCVIESPFVFLWNRQLHFHWGNTIDHSVKVFDCCWLTWLLLPKLLISAECFGDLLLLWRYLEISDVKGDWWKLLGRTR